jgi:outer membrane protein W
MFSFNLGYGLNDYLTLGFDLQWERHGFDLEASDISVGHSTAISLLPMVEVHPLGRQTFTPYLLFGLGYNINTFGYTDEITAAFARRGLIPDVDMDNTFALRAGLGTDVFLTDYFALNLDLGWKYNKGSYRQVINGVDLTENDFNASVFSALFGFRFYLAP